MSSGFFSELGRHIPFFVPDHQKPIHKVINIGVDGKKQKVNEVTPWGQVLQIFDHTEHDSTGAKVADIYTKAPDLTGIPAVLNGVKEAIYHETRGPGEGGISSIAGWLMMVVINLMLYGIDPNRK